MADYNPNQNQYNPNQNQYQYQNQYNPNQYNPYNQNPYQNPYPYQPGPQQPKSTFLKVMGILLIIFGAIAILVDLVALSGVSTLSYWLGGGLGLIVVMMIVALVEAVVELVSGIVGISSSKDPNKAGRCVVLGALMIILCIVVMIIQAASGLTELYSYLGMGSTTVISFISGLIMPVLYLVAAILFTRKK